MNIPLKQSSRSRPSTSSSRAFASSSQSSSYIPSSQFSSPGSYQSQATAPSSFSSTATFMSTYSHAMPAPLSSPSSGQPNSQFFPTVAPAATSQQNNQQESQGNLNNSQVSHPNYSQHGEARNNPAATAPYLRDFNLVAEAAKRAQIKITMRDLEALAL